MTWTRFMDMHSGGGQKEDFAYCYIEASEEEAKLVFFNRFGHDPERITCGCCGSDYSIDAEDDLAQLTGYDRKCAFVQDNTEADGGHYVEQVSTPRWFFGDPPALISLDDYLHQADVRVIYASDITDEERTGKIRKSGWVYQD